jgi:threonine dehydratase
MPSSRATESAATALPGPADVAEAAARIAGKAVRTPLLEADGLNALVGGRVLVKAEMLQRTGSFKFRGAYNRISRLSEDERRRGVVAFSSGNHAQGVAAAAALVSTPATIVMPSDAPEVKVAGTRRWGAEIVFYDRASESREAIGERLMTEREAVLVRPYDDFFIIAGQGTVGLEIAEQCAEWGVMPDAVLAPVGGGGLIAGTSLGLAHGLSEVPVFGVEPEGFDDTARSLAAGKRLSVEPGAASFCDALVVPTPGELTFEINRRRLAGGLAVPDEDTAKAMAQAFLHLKLVAEPGGAVALAAVLSGRFDAAGKIVVVVSSGGNVDPATYRKALDSLPE